MLLLSRGGAAHAVLEQPYVRQGGALVGSALPSLMYAACQIAGHSSQCGVLRRGCAFGMAHCFGLGKAPPAPKEHNILLDCCAALYVHQDVQLCMCRRILQSLLQYIEGAAPDSLQLTGAVLHLSECAAGLQAGRATRLQRMHA